MNGVPRMSIRRSILLSLAILVAALCGVHFASTKSLAQGMGGMGPPCPPLGTTGGSTPALRMMMPGDHWVQAPGFVGLAADVDLGGGYVSDWATAVFVVDGTEVAAMGSGNIMCASFDMSTAANPSEHHVYAKATVLDSNGCEYSLDSTDNAPGPPGTDPLVATSPYGDGQSMLFALADIRLRWVEFSDSHPISYDEYDYAMPGGNFTVPSVSGDPNTRPQWELVTEGSPPAQVEYGPYALCRTAGETTALKLGTNVGGAAPQVRIHVRGETSLAIPAWNPGPNWEDGWHVDVDIAGSGFGNTVTPPLVDAIEIDTVHLELTTQLVFTDGFIHWVTARDLYFEAYTDFGPRVADPVPDPANETLWDLPPNEEGGMGGGGPLVVQAGSGGTAPRPAHSYTTKYVAQSWSRGPTAGGFVAATERMMHRIYGVDPVTGNRDPMKSKIVYDPGQGDKWTTQTLAGGILTGEDFWKASFAQWINNRPEIQCSDVSSMLCTLMKEIGLNDAKVLFLPGTTASAPNTAISCQDAYWTGNESAAGHPKIFIFHQVAQWNNVFDAALSFGLAPAWPPANLPVNSYIQSLGCRDSSHNGRTNRYVSGYDDSGVVVPLTSRTGMRPLSF